MMNALAIVTAHELGFGLILSLVIFAAVCTALVLQERRNNRRRAATDARMDDVARGAQTVANSAAFGSRGKSELR